ncbi:Predicted arabinose efflux permease, MFS family [Micromonospora pattaloongensis]|uniref:Predicted arabinose efflux permease, MFS family n=1 Tax=Micromonospora pattaloongensis TaxID=405436 RepID=A0A1H3FV71_9ACTN|nr:MFS transporter [Micromonospora pattaloongensis]SDX94029.1 Predicted arabinose efflux permease, MFS family [Micromonospora pattaloongensis]
MTLTPYRRALALPGIRSLLIVAMLARIPVTAASVTLTLHVVDDLHRGYAAAGLVAAVMTVGSAIGAPLLGRLVDRRGLRPMLVLTTVAEALFWAAAQAMPYPALLVTSFFGGLLTLPIFSVIRQSIAALAPEDQRRQAYALDSMSVELSFMIGPALAVLMVTTTSARSTMLAVGAGIVCSGLALFALNPPVRGHDEPSAQTAPVARREWVTPRLVGVLAIVAASTLVLGGTDVAVVAVLRDAGQMQWTGAVLAAWGAYSLVGGFAYGAVSRPLPPVALLILLGACTIPVGLGGGQWWLLCLALLPAGALCAPTLAATADVVSRLAPPSARGEAMGLHGSALTVGLALGAPLAGAVIDGSGPAWGFAATGLLGLLVGLVVLPGELRRRRTPQAAAPTTPTPDLVPSAPTPSAPAPPTR